ncbi:hypothetical protein [Leptospira brenneri]|uniref:Glycosyltransferase RgtA/B/C/D-like domain-containing protein n=1 Tax=Leptospira brenneri TaxID=2023182 RepID=A0A2M9Y6V2_9LEPT|nr:hypothetical protein [Leptospira brenneri]PJZ47173.1 hypothetical protein CH361_02170 [Leptospira brenneri]TGK95868.1 hypothetical protein EHQ30_04360 [Leptospira brenneri]
MFGKDIYWYGVQAVSLIETGKLHSPDHSPVFHIVAFLFRFFGTSDESLFAFQILTSVWLFLSIIIARKLVLNSFGLPSVIFFVLSFLYPKQSWALGFLILSIGFYFSTNLRWKWIYLGISFVFALWFHSMVGILGLGLFVLYKIPRKFDLILFLFVAFLPLILPKELGERITFETHGFPILLAFGIAGVGFLWDWFFMVFEKNVSHTVLLFRRTIAFMGFLLVLPLFHFADIQYRILLSLILLSQIFTIINWKQYLITGVSFILWAYTVFNSPNLFRYPYEQMWDPGEKAATFSNNGLLVAHHGFCEFYHFQFRKDCLSWEPDEKAISELPSGTKIYRLVYGIRFENLRASKEDPNTPIFTLIEPLGEYQMVLEEDWKRYRLWLEKRNSKLLSVAKSWKNPYRKRPSFLKRKQSYGI